MNPVVVTPIALALIGIVGWFATVYIRDHSDAGRNRAKFRSYLDLVIRAIDAEHACNLAIPSVFSKCLVIKDFDERCGVVRPDIYKKGLFDAACESCKKVSFNSYNEPVRNEAKKAELLACLKKVRSLAK